MLSLVWLTLAAGPVTVAFAGDVTLGFHYQEHVDARIDAGVPRDQALAWGFERVGTLTSKADLFVVNLECPFTTSEERLPKNFNFRARPELVSSLSAGGVDVVSLANNHLMDFGAQGLFDTVTTLDAHRVAHFGAGRSLAEARAPAFVTVKGVRLAFLGYFFLGNANIEPEQVIATVKTPGVAGHHDSLEAMRAFFQADIAAAKAKADQVVVFVHWGREGRTAPEPYQVELGHLAIDLGAAAVIGSHPHVLQGIEQYRGAPIVYSLGNFVFGGNWNPKDKRTAVVTLTFTSTGVSGVQVTAAMSDAYPERPAQPYFPDDPGPVLAHLSELSAAFPETVPALRRPDAGVITAPRAAP